jgi:hypothetical protein
MEYVDYADRFHEALTKAFAARGAEVRAAYFDLASFYRTKLPAGAVLHPTDQTLARCLERTVAERRGAA